MAVPNVLTKLFFSSIIFLSFSHIILSQKPQINPVPEPTAESVDDDILKISTDLIQTGVMVFDKKGQFIDRLKQEDFELRVDGKAVPITFFENIAVRRNVAQKDIEKGVADSKNNEVSPVVQNAPVERGRTVIFVVDDIHLSIDSTNRTRKLINKFIDQDMLANDTVAIVSSSSKIGFLQQFTDNKTVLKAAVEKLTYTRNFSANDRMPPPMTEYEALLISQWDPEVTDLFTQLDPMPGDPDSKKESVRTRARGILTLAANISRKTYSTLDGVIRSSAAMPGRKIVFFISDGFIPDPINSSYSYLMKRITDAAARANAVIYTFDAKGLEAGFPEDGATANSLRLALRTQSGERFEVQTGLRELADSTGGEFIRNTNDLQTELEKYLEEASTYYLLAWQPEDQEKKSEKLRRIEVGIKNRPELKVRLQNGYLNEVPVEAKDKSKNKPDKNTAVKALSPVDQQLTAALTQQQPARLLPAALVVNYLDLPNEGALLAATLKINSDDITFTQTADKSVGNVDVLGAVYDAEGKRESYFRELLTVSVPTSKKSENRRADILYNYQRKLKPGLYQLRIAVRDAKSARAGSVKQWLEIPDLSSGKLTLSSILLGEQSAEDNRREKSIGNALAGVDVSADRSFSRLSKIRYLVFVYNPLQDKAKNNIANITLQTQILRGGKVMLESPAKALSSEEQTPLRIPYAAEIPLKSLFPGQYELKIVVQDSTKKISASRSLSFFVK
jgi:VWFA-related protein